MASPYEVAIHLTVTGNAQAGLAGLSQQMSKLNEGAEKLHKAFALIFVGGEMKRWGEDALGWVKKILDAAGNFQHVQSQMSAMGMTQKEIAEATGTAWKNATANIHVGVQEMAEMNRHAVEIFGSAAAAAEHMPLMARLAEFQAKWGAGKTGLKQVDVPSAIRDMMKTTEGAAMLSEDPKKFDVFAEKLMRSLIAAGGNVSATQILHAQRLARGAQFGWSDSFRFGVFPALVQEYGPAAGVSSYQAFKKLAAGVSFDKTGIVQGVEMGLIDPRKVEYDKVGRPLRLMPGAMIHAAEFTEDPLKFTEKFITPWLDKHTKNVGERTAAIVRLLGRATGMTAIQGFDLQAYKFEKDRALWGNARMEMPDDYAQAMKAFEEKWKDFIVAVGTPSLKAAATALGGMTTALVAITGAVNAHPEAAKNLLAIATGFGIAMTALGALAIGAGIAGLLGGGVIIVGLTALTGALAGFAVANWTVLAGQLSRLDQNLVDFGVAIEKTLKAGLDKLAGWLTAFGDAISELWSKLKSLNPFSHTSYEGGGVGGGGGRITNAAWSGGGGGVIPGGAGGGDVMGAVAGSAVLRQYLATGGHGMDPRTTAWCAAYVGAYLNHHGMQSLKSNVATSYLNYGSAVSGAPLPGDVVVIPRGHGAGQTGGHVGIATGRASGNMIEMLAGNTGHRVAREWERRSSAVVRRPPHHGGTEVYNHIYLDGKMIAKSTSKHLVHSAQYATSVGRQDGRGVFMGPGAEVFA